MSTDAVLRARIDMQVRGQAAGRAGRNGPVVGAIRMLLVRVATEKPAPFEGAGAKCGRRPQPGANSSRAKGVRIASMLKFVAT